MRVKSWDFTKNVQHVGCKVNPCLGLAIPALITCHFILSLMSTGTDLNPADHLGSFM